MRYRAYTSRKFYLTGLEKDFMYFGNYSSKKLAKTIAKIFGIIRKLFTKGQWNGVKYGIIYEKGKK